MDAQAKALKSHRRRLRARGVKRVEVLVRTKDVALVRRLAAGLRSGAVEAQRLRDAVAAAVAGESAAPLAELLYDPAIAGPEFDEIFRQIDRSRKDARMMKLRDVEW